MEIYYAISGKTRLTIWMSGSFLPLIRPAFSLKMNGPQRTAVSRKELW